MKAFSVTQKRVTLSSAEAELGAAVRSTAELIGVVQCMSGMGLGFRVGDASNIDLCRGRVYVDSSAALGVVARRGNGKLRHIRVGQLWIQELAAAGEFQFRKIAGTRNPADLLTKYLPAAKMVSLLESLQVELVGGRADAGLTISSVDSGRSALVRGTAPKEECKPERRASAVLAFGYHAQ